MRKNHAHQAKRMKDRERGVPVNGFVPRASSSVVLQKDVSVLIAGEVGDRLLLWLFLRQRKRLWRA